MVGLICKEFGMAKGNMETSRTSRTFLWNITTTAVSTDLEPIGIHDSSFELIHITAITSLAISILVSVCVLIYLLGTGAPLRKKTVGERLAIHLATCDLLYSISHLLDHAYMEAVRSHPPSNVCVSFAFFLGEFILVQSVLLTFTAINAFLLVVKEMKINLGVFDWKLLLGAYGIPAVGMTACAISGYLGPSGAWCLFDMRDPSGNVANGILSAIQVTTFTINLVSYISVWIKIKQVSRETRRLGMHFGQAINERNIATARILSLFVCAYLFQWWPYVTSSIWAAFETPHISMFFLTILLCNMGGVFNCVAYTCVRIKLRRRSQAGGAHDFNQQRTFSILVHMRSLARGAGNDVAKEGRAQSSELPTTSVASCSHGTSVC